MSRAEWHILVDETPMEMTAIEHYDDPEKLEGWDKIKYWLEQSRTTGQKASSVRPSGVLERPTRNILPTSPVLQIMGSLDLPRQPVPQVPPEVVTGESGQSPADGADGDQRHSDAGQ